MEPPEGPLPAWQQLQMAANALGAGWQYSSSAEIMDEIGDVVSFYSGASHENLIRDYGRQWPCTTDKPLGTAFLFEDGVTGRPFKFRPVPRPEATEEAPSDYPLVLVFGHSLYYWHQNVRVAHSETLKRELRVVLLDYPEGFVEINDADAKHLGVRDGQKIRLVSDHGVSAATARVTPEVRGGIIFVPFFVREVLRQITGDPAFMAGQRNKPVYVRVEKA
jgi:predicted molibdopterin-dependent oxidoreductase YjgC